MQEILANPDNEDEGTSFSETSETIYDSAWHHMPENFKSSKYIC
jgi:hypothetical protein